MSFCGCGKTPLDIFGQYILNIDSTCIYGKGKMEVKKTIGKMLHPRDGEVWANPIIESMRRDECLCLNGCANMKPGEPDHCQIAQRLFDACVDGKAALMVTRCGLYTPKS